MRNEIGSEFWTGSLPLGGLGAGELIPQNFSTRFVLSGRTALDLIVEDILKTRGAASVYLPSYCCHTMIEPFVSHNIRVEFYNVYFSNNGINADFNENNECDIIYLLDYFGFKNPETAYFAETQKNKIIIYDATHSVFCKNHNFSAYDYVFASFRKWFGVNAAFCSKKSVWKYFPELCENSEYVSVRNRCFDQKALYMSGENIDKSLFLEGFAKAENMLEHDYAGYSADEASLRILGGADIEYIRNRRRANAQMLIKGINGMGSSIAASPYAKINENDCPLFVPFKILPDKRESLRAFLIDSEIYLPVHWPLSPLHAINADAAEIYKTELSGICDQRYSGKNIETIISTIGKALKLC